MDIYTALVHHPVTNRVGDVVTTSVTNLDIHDFARISRSYDCRGVFIVTPVTEQLALVGRIVGHWWPGDPSEPRPTGNPTRTEAFSRVAAVPSLDAAVSAIAERHGSAPWIVGTSARRDRETLSFASVRERVEREDGALLLVFGTGWGLAPAALAATQAMLEPIEAVGPRAGYNHLPVRAACAIILDRVCGAR
jgi:hypothetical protein